MAKVKAEFKDGKITIDLEDIKEDETILRELAKTVVFDNTLMECFAKLLVSDWIEYEDEPDGWPNGWWSTWSGKGQVFEAMRQVVAQKADETAQKLIGDLTNERDCLHGKLEQERKIRWQLEAQIREMRREAA